MRVKTGPTRHRKHKKIRKLAKGYWGARSRWYKLAKESVIRAGVYAYRDRKVRKRNMRKLWILRINAATRPWGLTYSRFIHGLRLASVGINRQLLAKLCIEEPEAFKALIDTAKEKLKEAEVITST